MHVGLTSLQELSLDNTAITDEGMRHITGLRNLVYLSLSDTRYVVFKDIAFTYIDILLILELLAHFSLKGL